MSKYRLDLNAVPQRATFSAPLDETPGERRIAAARRLKGHLKILLSIPVVLALLYVGSLGYNFLRVAPRGVETVQDFYRRYGNPPRIDTLFLQGRTYYRVTGEIPAPLSFPKGNPMYVFDDSGRLVDWTGESRGDPGFLNRWSNDLAQRMSIAYFLEKFPPN